MPPYFKLCHNPDDPNTQGWPVMLKATVGNVIKRTGGSLTVVNNQVVWDLFTDSDIQDCIAENVFINGAPLLLTIEIYNSYVEMYDNIVQTIVIPIYQEDPFSWRPDWFH